MSATPGTHGPDHLDAMTLYALRALPAAEVPAAEAQLAACGGCRDELERLRRLVGALQDWPTDVLRPPDPLWDRLARRIAGETGTEAFAPGPARAPWPDWEEAAPGIFTRLLATDTERHRVSMLVRLAPRTAYPPHRHAGFEELHLLDGELTIGDRTLHPGDYNRAEAGTEDHLVYSETGCTCVLVTSFRDVIL
jgi:anti-sigma factor ChrR (cupin superfamily)